MTLTLLQTNADSAAAVGLGLAGFLLLIALALAVYFLPAILGCRKRNALAIFAMNLLLGWIGIGWVIAFVWALTKDAPPVVVQQSNYQPHYQQAAPPPIPAPGPQVIEVQPRRVWPVVLGTSAATGVVMLGLFAAFSSAVSDGVKSLVRPSPAPSAQAAAGVVSALLTATPSPSPTPKGYTTLRREDFGEAWPLTVEKGRLWCEPGGALLLISNGTIYAVNRAAAESFAGQYRPVDEVWAEDETGAKKDLTPLIDEGMKLCQP